jgi:hypothetical protein
MVIRVKRRLREPENRSFDLCISRLPCTGGGGLEDPSADGNEHGWRGLAP